MKAYERITERKAEFYSQEVDKRVKDGTYHPEQTIAIAMDAYARAIAKEIDHLEIEIGCAVRGANRGY